jgi:glycerate 2-kinase
MKEQKGLFKDAEEIFRTALAAVDPERLVRRCLKLRGAKLSVDSKAYDLDNFERVIVIGAGKGSAPMARGVEKVLGKRIDHGLVIVKYGHTVPLEKVRIVDAGHPIPDKNGVVGAREILEILSGTGKRDLVISLFSGGGSALMDDFQAGITLADVQKATSLLLSCGADISEINTIRKHVSKVKGGRLARTASPSPMINLLLSDVIGDDLDVIASGPTVPDESTFADAMEVLERYGLKKRFPKRIMDYLKLGLTGKVSETPKRGDPIFNNITNRIVGNNRMALSAAASRAKRLGYRPLILSARLQGEAKEAAKFLTAVAKEVSEQDRPVKKPACLIAGGETTVTLCGKGMGGRNQETALSAAMEINGWVGIVFLSGGSDGTDGPTDAAGGMVDGKSLARAMKKSINIRSCLDRNDSYRFFKEFGGHLITGPTLTNVMDIVVILIV